MATTTNYGWETPDDTDLVKDGASAIRTLGSSIDTTTKALNPSTTLGDIEYRSSTANTNTRLGIGSSGQVLSVSGGVPAWTTISSGGMTLLSTTTLSGSATTISSISGDYTHLYVIAYGLTTASQNYRLYIAVNGNAGTDNAGVQTTGSTTGAAYSYTGDYLRPHAGSSYLLYTNAENAFSFTIYNYASTSIRKPFSVNSGFYWDAIPDRATYVGGGLINSTSAVTSLGFNTTASTFSAGTVLVYGVK